MIEDIKYFWDIFMYLKRRTTKIKKIYIVILLSIVGTILTCFFIGRDGKMKTVAGYNYEYEYHERKLSVDNFRQFGYETTYLEVVDAVGEENGDIGDNYFYPYYELSDGTYAIIYFYSRAGSIGRIDIADRKEILYSLLPLRVPHRNEEDKERELLHAKQYEMNIIMELLGIEQWEKPRGLKKSDNPMGTYSEKELKKYIDADLSIEIDYWFEDYEKSNDEPLYQSIKVYQDDEECASALIAWNCRLVIESEWIPMKEMGN